MTSLFRTLSLSSGCWGLDSMLYGSHNYCTDPSEFQPLQSFESAEYYSDDYQLSDPISWGNIPYCYLPPNSEVFQVNSDSSSFCNSVSDTTSASIPASGACFNGSFQNQFSGVYTGQNAQIESNSNVTSAAIVPSVPAEELYSSYWQEPLPIVHRDPSRAPSIHDCEQWQQEQDCVPMYDIDDDYSPISPVLSPNGVSPTIWPAQQCQEQVTPQYFVPDASPTKRRRVNCRDSATFSLLPFPESSMPVCMMQNSLPPYQDDSPCFYSPDIHPSQSSWNGSSESPMSGESSPYTPIVPGHPLSFQTATNNSGYSSSFPASFRTKRSYSSHPFDRTLNIAPSDNVPGVYFDKRKKGFRVRFQNVYVGWVSLSRYSTFEEAYLVAKKIWDEAVREVTETQDKHAAVNAGITLQIQSRLKTKNPEPSQVHQNLRALLMQQPSPSAIQSGILQRLPYRDVPHGYPQYPVCCNPPLHFPLAASAYLDQNLIPRQIAPLRRDINVNPARHFHFPRARCPLQGYSNCQPSSPYQLPCAYYPFGRAITPNVNLPTSCRPYPPRRCSPVRIAWDSVARNTAYQVPKRRSLVKENRLEEPLQPPRPTPRRATMVSGVSTTASSSSDHIYCFPNYSRPSAEVPQLVAIVPIQRRSTGTPQLHVDFITDSESDQQKARQNTSLESTVPIEPPICQPPLCSSDLSTKTSDSLTEGELEKTVVVRKVSETYKRRCDGTWKGLGLREISVDVSQSGHQSDHELVSRKMMSLKIERIENEDNSTTRSFGASDDRSIMDHISIDTYVEPFLCSEMPTANSVSATIQHYDETKKRGYLTAREQRQCSIPSAKGYLSARINIQKSTVEYNQSIMPLVASRPSVISESKYNIKKENLFDRHPVVSRPKLPPLPLESVERRLGRVVKTARADFPNQPIIDDTDSSEENDSDNNSDAIMISLNDEVLPESIQIMEQKEMGRAALNQGDVALNLNRHELKSLLKHGSVTERGGGGSGIEIRQPGVKANLLKKLNRLNETSSSFSYENDSRTEELKRIINSLVRQHRLPESSVLKFDDLNFRSVIVPDKPTPQQQLKLEEINSGTFCTVFKGELKSSQIVVAVKCPLQQHLINDPEMMRIRAMKEWRLLARTNAHSNILKFHGGIVLSRYEVWLITEYIRGGDLYTKLYQEPHISIPAVQRLKMMLQISSALSYLHGLEPKIVHKDLKTNNILVDGSYDIRLCDFGDAEEIRAGESLKWYTAVTWQYAPPEIILSKDPSRPERYANESVDIWSFGCIILELCYRPTPFWHILERVDPVHHHVALQNHIQQLLGRFGRKSCRVLRSRLPHCLSVLVDWCLEFDQSSRPTAKQVYHYILQFRSSLVRELGEMESRQPKRARIIHPILAN